MKVVTSVQATVIEHLSLYLLPKQLPPGPGTQSANPNYLVTFDAGHVA